MRLTNVLLRRSWVKHNYAYLARREWFQKGSVMKIRRLILHPEVEAKMQGQQIENMLTSDRYENQMLEDIKIGHKDAIHWLEESQKLEAIRKAEMERDLTDALVFRQESRFEEGVKQAALLTKCQVVNGLAPSIQTIYNDLTLPESTTEMLQRYVLRSHVWQTDEDKLPRRFRPELPIYRHKSEFGIHPKNIVRYLLTDLFRHSQIHQASTNPAILSDRVLIRDQPLNTFYSWRDKRVHFMETRDHVLAGRYPLPFLANPDKVIETQDHPLDDMDPISPVIDLQKTRIKVNNQSFDGWTRETADLHPLNHSHLFSINFSLPSLWSDFLEPEADQLTQDQKNAAVIMHCFGQAVATAARLYGDDLVTKGEVLPAPVVTQAVCSDGVYFDFASFQLNTLDFSDNSGVKNQVWIDGGRKLFEKEVPKRSMLRNTRYRDLDSDVYRRFLSLYLYGSEDSL